MWWIERVLEWCKTNTELCIALCVAVALSVLVSSFWYFATLFVWLCRKRAKARRARRMERLRQLQYTLPDRENTYVRARLNTVLQPPQERDYKQLGDGEPVRLSYAKKLLARVREAELSTAERLQTEDIGRVFALYLQKPRWDAADLRVVNDTFAALLKLSAKYAVAV